MDVIYNMFSFNFKESKHLLRFKKILTLRFAFITVKMIVKYALVAY